MRTVDRFGHVGFMTLLLLLIVGCDKKTGGSQSDPKLTKARVSGGAPSTSGILQKAGQETVIEKKKIDPVDLKTAGPGSKRRSYIEEIANNSQPQELANFLVQNQGSLTAEDFIGLSNLPSILEKLGSKGLVDSINRLQIPWLQDKFFEALITRLSLEGDPGAFSGVAMQMPGPEVRRRFLVEYFAKLESYNPGAVIDAVQGMRDLNPQKETHWYNQLVGDSFARMPVDKIDTSWGMLDKLSDPSTRTIAAQRIFGALYEHDSVQASAWLNNVPNGADKNAAVSYLIQRLDSEGFHEDALAWKASIKPQQ